MTGTEITGPESPSPSLSPLGLWLGISTGVVMWIVHLVASYLLVPFACATGYSFVFHLTTGLTAGATLAASIMSYRGWRESNVGFDADASIGTEPHGALRRQGFMALLALMLNAMMLLLILVEAGGTFVLSPCRGREYGADQGSVQPPALCEPAACRRLPSFIVPEVTDHGA